MSARLWSSRSAPFPPRGLLVLLAAGALHVADPAAAAAAPEARRLVVVLYPEDTDGSPGTVGADRGIRSAFAGSPEYVEVRNEYVDVSAGQVPELKRLQREYLKRKYAGRRVDLVIAVLSSAFDFALEHRAEIFPGAPLVYCAVDRHEVAVRTVPPGVAGVPMWVDMAATLDLALRLHPDTRRVFVVAGSAPFDRAWEAAARETFRAYEDRLEFVYLTGLPMDDLLARVATLPGQSVIYYLHVFQDGTGRGFVPADVLELLSRKASTPVYGHSDVYAGRGAVGGRMISLEAEGRTAARLGLRILSGERPEVIAITDANESADVFDWRQLRRWGIDERRLPPGSVVRYRELTFWDSYKWYVLGGSAVLGLQTLLIAGLLVQRLQRRRADERFRKVVETAPTGMLMVGRDGTIVLANAQAEKLFGYAQGELLGRPVEELVPERARGRHVTDRLRFFEAPEARPMGLGRDLSGLRKDGSEFPAEIGLSPLRTPQGVFVLASVIDLTERRRAEADLRALTRRLLEAQETERRRIARELHDDVNQSLALLSVEMDLLTAAPGSSPGEAAGRVRELSIRVKELSSAVHDLSHQLHPSKLEQLGLVAALRGLCKELAQPHGVDVKFTHFNVPEAIAPATALCLYRIAQEALRNAIKHSGTRHAAVELSGAGGEIRLRVADDGVGFDPATRGGGLGLVSLRERLHLVGGRIAIDSRPGGGTRIEVAAPVPDREEGP